jgi:hypothetical protein
MSLPLRDWFSMQPPSELHGPGHTARVMVWAGVLARGTPWLDVVLWAAACHDLRRVDDGDDLQHGHRAGKWVRTKLPARLRTPPAQLELIARACDWHVCSDDESEWDHESLWLLKDADGLDRVRLGDLDPSFLRHEHTHHWIDQAEALYSHTSEMDDPERIWQEAEALGLPLTELRAFVAREKGNLV